MSHPHICYKDEDEDKDKWLVNQTRQDFNLADLDLEFAFF